MLNQESWCSCLKCHKLEEHINYHTLPKKKNNMAFKTWCPLDCVARWNQCSLDVLFVLLLCTHFKTYQILNQIVDNGSCNGEMWQRFDKDAKAWILLLKKVFKQYGSPLANQKRAIILHLCHRHLPRWRTMTNKLSVETQMTLIWFFLPFAE